MLRMLLSLALVASLLTPCALSQEAPAPLVQQAWAQLPEQVRVFNDHLVFLANPALEGRLPGSPGMEVAKNYAQHWFEKAGLRPGFPGAGEGEASWRQPFELGGRRSLVSQSLVVGEEIYAKGSDYVALGLGSSGRVKSEAVLLGYAIAEGPEGFRSFPADLDLRGKVALLFRFEPMDEEGNSRWSRRKGSWTGSAGFERKVRAASRAGAEAVIIINPPGCADARSERLGGGSMRGRGLGLPVLLMSTEAASRWFAKEGLDLMACRKEADEGQGVRTLKTPVALTVDISRKALKAENVGGFLPGKGALKDEIIVMGAHLDHLGNGAYGTRFPGELHPGADDNASGSAAVLMLGERLKKRYDALPEGADARSILFVCFDAEEAGLHGSRYYVENPIFPLEKHALMCNFDMIGRIQNRRLSVSGVGTAKDMDKWLEPLFAASPLEIVARNRSGGGSDHLPFASKGVPILFAIIADFHREYHTPEDVSYKINRVDAVHTVDLFEEILFTAGTRAEPFERTPTTRRRRRGR